MPVASAQVKSCIMIAGIKAQGPTTIIQPELSRDHTERMLEAMGANIAIENLSIEIKPSDLSALDVVVPGDISGAAFWMVLASCHPDASITLKREEVISFGSISAKNPKLPKLIPKMGIPLDPNFLEQLSIVPSPPIAMS